MTLLSRDSGHGFDKIKHFFIETLFKAGFKHLAPNSIGNNELRYILWRSYENLANPGRYRAFEWEAEDVAMRDKLGLMNAEDAQDAARSGSLNSTKETERAAEGEVRFLDGDFSPRDRQTALAVYERMLRRG